MEGGEGLRYGEIVTAVAMAVVIFVVLEALFLVVLVPAAGSFWGINIGPLAAAFVTAVIVGLAFASQIQESRLGSVGRIAILGTVLLTFGSMIAFSTNGYYNTLVQESINGMYSTSAWTTTDWYVHSWMAMISTVAENAVLAFVLTFVGLYLGSLRKR